MDSIFSTAPPIDFSAELAHLDPRLANQLPANAKELYNAMAEMNRLPSQTAFLEEMIAKTLPNGRSLRSLPFEAATKRVDLIEEVTAEGQAAAAKRCLTSNSDVTRTCIGETVELVVNHVSSKMEAMTSAEQLDFFFRVAQNTGKLRHKYSDLPEGYGWLASEKKAARKLEDDDGGADGSETSKAARSE